MPEMSGPGKNHGKAQGIAGFDGVLVPYGTSGLYDGFDAPGGGGFDYIGEGEEGVRGEDPCAFAVSQGAF
jgi:hypothetical protein